MPYVSAQYPENSTKSLPGDLPDFNEIKPMSVYEPFVLCRDSSPVVRNTRLC